MKSFKIIIAFILLTNALMAQKYTIADDGSKVTFVIKNFGSKTNGSFTGLTGVVIFNPKALTTSTINASISAATVNTNNNARDKHLKKSEYFDVEKFTTITFVSTKITESSTAGRFFIFGNLTIKGITKAIQFGFSATPNTNGYIFAGDFEINRRDFGVGGNSISMADKLKVYLNITAKN
ncbi:MAG: YceI family protein [Ferruginibacter sp.]|nr:YceI family protein [Ferruginibacter sp.]